MKVATLTLRLLPPFRLLHLAPRSIRDLLRWHLLVAGGLYTAFLGAAAINGTLWSETGIGVLQNPPFYAHLITTFASVPVVVLMIARVRRCLLRQSGRSSLSLFLLTAEKSRLPEVMYGTVLVIGLASLAASIVMATGFTIDIYDSAHAHPLTFAFYTLIRAYAYVFCYPFLVAAPLSIAIALFNAIRSSNIKYQPFATDSLGGLKTYLRAVDIPVYLIQCVAALIAIANYVSWGGISPIPSLLSFGALLLVTSMGAALHIAFTRLVRHLRFAEITQIRERQRLIYDQLRSDNPEDIRDTKVMVEEIEAGDRLVDIIRKRRSFGWVKYAANLFFASVPVLYRAAAAGIASSYGELSVDLIKNISS